VTSLADTGTGTFRDALSAGNRYIVFDVGGTVLLGTPPPTGGGASDPNDTINFTGSNVTIDGSTAPSPGITVYANVNILNDGLRFRDNTNTILTYIRFLGNEPNAPTVTDCTAGFVNEDLLSAWPTSGVGSVQDIVWDHLTIRNVGDSGFDVAGRVVNATFSYNYILWNCHPQTMGTSSDPSSNMTWHHNLWASNGERLPQFSKVHDNMDYRNNILFKWNNSYAIRIRNSPATDKISANFVNNYFFAGTAATNAAIMYGLTTGADAAEENGPGSCTTQGTLYTAGLMGEIYVAGNTFSAANCETYSTVPTERFVPSASQVATDAATSLVSTVLPGVGTIYRRTDEQTEITSVNTALGGPAACGNGVVEGAEVCDDGNTVTETACSYGIPSCTLCNAGCSAPLSLTGQYCGDSVLNGPELCDTGPGYVLTTTCIGLGFSGGTLVCAANCLSYNTSGCSVTPVSATLSGGAILSGGSLP
jgi:cysteine-rich repeat protein